MEARQRKFEKNAQKEDQIFQQQQAQIIPTKILTRPPKVKQPIPLELKETQTKVKDPSPASSVLIMAFINAKKF